MTPEQFVYWLQGYTAALEAPEDWRMAAIRKRLAEVEMGKEPNWSQQPALRPSTLPVGSPQWLSATGQQEAVPYAYNTFDGFAIKADGTPLTYHDIEPGIVKAMDPIATVDRCDTSKFFLRGADAEDDDFEGAPV